MQADHIAAIQPLTEPFKVFALDFANVPPETEGVEEEQGGDDDGAQEFSVTEIACTRSGQAHAVLFWYVRGLVRD